MTIHPHDIEERKVDESVVTWSLGGPSLAFRTHQTLLYLDLFTGPSPVPDVVTKAIPEVIDPTLIRAADLALSTHHDEDHCHKDSLEWLHRNTNCLFLGPVSCNKLYRDWEFELSRTRQIAAYEIFGMLDVLIHAYPSKDVFDPDAVTYVLDLDGVTIFDSGDTLYIQELKQIGQKWDLDLAFLSYARNPSDRRLYMGEEEVLHAAKDLGARKLILKHYDLWEEFSIDPTPLLKLLQENGQDAQILALGECLEWRKNS